MSRKISPRAVDELKRLEGLRLKAYQDGGGVWTIGYGHTKGVKPNDVWTLERAEQALVEDLYAYEAAVDEMCYVHPTQSQFDAMVLLCYNIGVTGFKKSTVLKAHNRGDFVAASRAFGLWVKDNGKIVNGLVARRAFEAALYLEGTPKAPATVTPDPEKPMRKSTINLAGSVGVVTATGAGVQQVLDTLNKVQDSAAQLSAWLAPGLTLAAALLCAYIVYERFQQRKRGSA
jgi:lysozyme